VTKKATAIWRVEVDHDRCMATEACVHAMPEVFAIGDDGTSTVIGSVDGNDEFLRDVVAECPTDALRLVCGDDAGED
jgi:ferredoxin